MAALRNHLDETHEPSQFFARLGALTIARVGTARRWRLDDSQSVCAFKQRLRIFHHGAEQTASTCRHRK